MNPVYILIYVIFAHEFGNTKGTLHSHSSVITDKKSDTVSNKIGVVICDLAHQVVAAVDALDKYISSVYTAEENEASFGGSHVLYCNYKALKKREKFYNLTKGGKRAFKEYESSTAAADDNTGGGNHIYLRCTEVYMLVILAMLLMIGLCLVVCHRWVIAQS